ncbi:MAG: VWA domain-containing protein [Candidatus Pacebacteria bacterium]|nr:VWA domain-containing protein [Candidatus Paceibacterota bacterium]
MPHIHSPWWALLVVPLAVGFVLSWRRRPPTLKASEVESFGRAAVSVSRFSLNKIPLILAGLGALLLIVALMRPQKGRETIIKRAEGVDIMLALDASGSMQVYDVPPQIGNERQFWQAVDDERLKPRIEVAKEELTKFVSHRPEDRFGLVVFAKYTYVVSPPTLDHDFLLQNLQRLEAGQFPDGTEIAAPLSSGTSRLKGSAAKRRVLILFTDGENTVDANVTPLQAAKVARTFDVIVHTVGVGSSRAVRVRDTIHGRFVSDARAGFNRELLRTIADMTGGRYFEARDAAGFKAVMEAIDELEPTTMEQTVYVDYSERFLPWLVSGMALLLLAFVLDNSVLQVVP